MMKSILKVKYTTMEKLNFPGKISKYEINLIKELVEILRPFVLATDQIEGDSGFYKGGYGQHAPHVDLFLSSFK
ncbi:UNVERIFIED_CONTAM: hypothetical protein FKN15_035976 [Acipenser sinensis]